MAKSEITADSVKLPSEMICPEEKKRYRAINAMKCSKLQAKTAHHSNPEYESDIDNSSASCFPDIQIKQESTHNSGNPIHKSVHSELVRLPVGLQNDTLNIHELMNNNESVNINKMPGDTSIPSSVLKKISQKFVTRSVDLQNDIQTGCCDGISVPLNGKGRDEQCHMDNEIGEETTQTEAGVASSIRQILEKSQESRVRPVRTKAVSKTGVAQEAAEDTKKSSHPPPDSEDVLAVSDSKETDVKYISDGFSGYESLDDSFVRFKDDSEDDADRRKSGRYEEDDDDDEYFPSNYKRKKRKRKMNTKNKRVSVSEIKDVSQIKEECFDPVFSDSWKIPDVMRLSDKTYACTFCIQICPKLKDARKHVLTHYEFICDLCDKRFLTAEQVELHTRNEHDGNCVKCPFSSCDFTAESKEELSKHVSDSHANEDLPDFNSRVDDSGISNSSNITRGASRYKKRNRATSCSPGNGSNPGLCYICGVQKRCLREHLYNVHGAYTSRYNPGQKDLICETCSAEFPNRLLLHNHRLTWHTEKTLPCRFAGCPALFKTKGLMQTHYKSVHLGIKRYICTYEGCSFRSGNKATFANHTKAMHLKIRSHPCTWPGCSKSFYDKKHLVIHERIHADVKPLRCEFCDYRCRQRAALNWHLTKKHKEQAVKSWEAGSNPANSWKQADVPVGIPAATHALKPGRKKKIPT